MAVAQFAQGVTDTNYWSAHLNNMKPQSTSAVTASTNTSINSGKPLLTTGADGKSFFENMLDIVNPLEHLPVVSTIYHAITGNQSGDVEKIAGDTLYGGPIGLLSSVADVAFEKITGKDFGDTVLAMVGLGGDEKDSGTKLASSTVKTPGTEVATTAALNKASLTPAAKVAQIATAAPLVTTTSPIPPIATTAPAQLTTPVATTVAATPPTTAQAAQSIIDISPQTDALLAALQKNGVTGAMQNQALDAYRRSMSMNNAPAASVTVH